MQRADARVQRLGTVLALCREVGVEERHGRPQQRRTVFGHDERRAFRVERLD